MNFKFTRLKVIISIAAGVLAFLIGTMYVKLLSYWGIFRCFGTCPFFGKINDGLQAGVIVLILVYLIWSFVDKKKLLKK